MEKSDTFANPSHFLYRTQANPPAPLPQAQMAGYPLQQRCIQRPSGLSPLIPGLLMIKEKDGGREGHEGGGN